MDEKATPNFGPDAPNIASLQLRKRERNHQVEGTVIDMYSKKPIPDAQIWLNHSGYSWFAGTISEKQATTDQDGKFNFSFKAGDDMTYYIEAGVYSRYTARKNGPLYIKNGSKNIGLIYECRPVCWIKLNIVNTEPRDTVDNILVNIASAAPADTQNQFMIGDHWNSLGLKIDQTAKDTSFITLMIEGADSATISITIEAMRKPTKLLVHSSTIFLAPLDTNEITLTY